MTIAEWSLLAAVLLYLLTLAPVKPVGQPRFDNANPRDPAFYTSGIRARALGAHINGIETFPFFAAAVLLAEFRGAAQGWVDVLALGFIAVRFAFVAAYLGNWPTTRTLLWNLGFAVNVAIFLAPLWGGAMTPFELTAGLMSLVALVGWINVKTVHMPHGVAMLVLGIAVALGLAAMRAIPAGAALTNEIVGTVAHIDFVTTVVGLMLPFLLFAGAMQVDLTQMRLRWASIAAIATLGVAGSVVVVGIGTWAIAHVLGISLSLPWALVFGALISPTDPVAVLATVKHGKLSKTLQVVLQGEALFNDGVGIVAFTALIAFATGVGDADPVHAVMTVVTEALGGLVFGITAAWLTIRAMLTIDEFAVEVSMTIALTMAVYALAQVLHLSGAIAVVGAGVMFGGERARQAMAGETEVYIKSFWTLVDEILNALLFLLLGIEMLIVPFYPGQTRLVAAVIILVVGARFAVVLPWGTYFRVRHAERGATTILGWGGLHGALSLALALSLPPGAERSLILTITYAVVAFSITIQGLTFTPLTRWLERRAR